MCTHRNTHGEEKQKNRAPQKELFIWFFVFLLPRVSSAGIPAWLGVSKGQAAHAEPPLSWGSEHDSSTEGAQCEEQSCTDLIP